ncbi:hypothetical protein SSX86_016425 [Deinandra increscens subsp. villosa]|uniref:Nucleic acid-binding protein n=1 Tax=Deinandra increscens subsp. villosa TaxID=3103831 RepID=A0AAP0D399_9ASTR
MIDKVRSLAIRGDGKTIQVRVIRRWSPRLNPEDVLYIFVDREGATVSVTTLKDDQEVVQPLISLNGCYLITGYVCYPPFTYQKPVIHPISLQVGPAYTITPIPDDGSIPTVYFEFCSRANLNLYKDNKKLVVDYIGRLDHIQDLISNDGRPYVRLMLMDASDKPIVLTIWNEIMILPERFNRQALNAATFSAIIVVAAVNVITYLSRHNAQNPHIIGQPAYESYNFTKKTVEQLLHLERNLTVVRFCY